LESQGLEINPRLSALFRDDVLLFRSFQTVRTFLDLDHYFVEASNDDIAEVLEHDTFAEIDPDSVTEFADSVMRRRFMAVKLTGILDDVKPHTVQRKAARFGLKLRINGGRLVFPDNRAEAKALLQYLLEGYYEGDLTGRLYVTNSQRQLP
jgi:hypothetical protein